MPRKTAAQIVAAASDEQLVPSAAALDEAANMLDESAGPSQADIDTAVAKLNAELNPATPIETPAAGEETPIMPADPKPLTKAQQKAAEKAAAAVKAAEEQPEPAPSDSAAAVLFTGGRTIAQIAVQTKMSQEKVREALTAAGVDYSADKNAEAHRAPAAPASSSAPAAPAQPFERLDKLIRKYAAGSLSPRRQGFSDRLKNDKELGLRIEAIGTLQRDNVEEFGAALCALLSFLATDYDSHK